MTHPLIREKIEAEVATSRDLERIAKDCAEKTDPDILRAAASRMEAIFLDHFEHEHFDKDTDAFNAFLEELRRSIAYLEP